MTLLHLKIYKDMRKLPELLCPAGDMAALQAAVDGGADAVYFGGVDFNARKNAANFDVEGMREAIKLAHAYGVKVYVTQNTLCFDREIKAYLSAAESAIFAGADALIVADIGGASEIKKRFPDCELHASTQMSGHNVAAAIKMAEMGMSRMVCAREMSFEDIKTFTLNSPIEAEVFVHGALCVCHSGQCLFSSLVGGRSGNRGECAQPCRLPYSGGYPLSLKDNSLALHICELIECGVASLKIEGRMKSPEYVRDVTRIYRRLLDEGRQASGGEMRDLAEIFSRGGFTDGYFTGRINKSMLGVRSDEDKRSTRELEPFNGMTRKIPIDLSVRIVKGEPCRVTMSSGTKTFEYVSDIVPENAINQPLTYESVKKQMTKFGSTPYEVREFSLELDGKVMLPVSVLNRLRRETAEAFSGDGEQTEPRVVEAELSIPQAKALKLSTASFAFPEQITEAAKEYFDIRFLPLDKYSKKANGVSFPAVIFDSEREKVKSMLAEAKKRGAEYALVGNLGHIELAKELGFRIYADFRLNIANNSSAAKAEELGFEGYVISPELSLPQARDMKGAKLALVYGRVPLMLLEKCVGKELGGCDKCNAGRIALRDRRGAEFPVLREWEHRSVIYNSLPTCMSDKQGLLEKNSLLGRHFIFSVETAAECDKVISAFVSSQPVDGAVRRMGNQ